MEEKLNTQTPDEILRKKQQEMSNEELAEKVDKAVSDMCKSGVKTFRMSIPPSVNDTDMLISELVRRFKEGNRLIADSPFSNDNLRNSIKIDCLNFSEEYAYSNLRYHSSWDWLMPIVEKIESMGYDFTMIKNYCRITTNTGGTFENELGSANQETKIAAAYKLVIEFIKWYNTQPHTKTVNN